VALLMPLLLSPAAAECIEELVAGADSACVRNSANEVRCWGNNAQGRLGQGDTANRGGAPETMGAQLPAINFGDMVLKKLYHGGAHVCGLEAVDARTDGKVLCWGGGSSGRLGTENNNDIGDNAGEMAALVAVPVPATCTVMQFEAFYVHNCIVCSDGKLYCFGKGEYGVLGLGNENNVGGTVGWGASWEASKVNKWGNVASLLPGTFGKQTCMLYDATNIACVGRNDYGQLGTGSTGHIGTTAGSVGDGLVKMTVPAGSTVKSGCVSTDFTCILYGAGTVECLGNGQFGRLGSDSSSNRGTLTGTTVHLEGSLGPSSSSFNPVAKISCGENHVCVVDDTGLEAACWGFNHAGKLGYDDTQNRGDGTLPMSSVPDVEVGGAQILDMKAGGSFTCANLESVGIKCWGDGNDGHLGTESTSNVADGTGHTIVQESAVDLPCLIDPTDMAVTVPAGWKTEAIGIPDEDGDYELALKSFQGRANFWWINGSMRGGTVYDITPDPYVGPATSVFPVNTTFTINCKHTSCDVFVFLYHDPPTSSSTNGNLISLVDDGWEASSCAPTFYLGLEYNAKPTCVYKMVALRNTIGSGESTTVKIEERPAAYVMFAVVPKMVCGNTMTPAECQATHSDYGPVSTCEYVNGACIDNWCPRRHTTRPPDFTRPPTMACPAANAGLTGLTS